MKRTHFIAGVFSLSSSDPKIISSIREHENVILDFMMRKRYFGFVRVIRNILTSKFIGTFKVDTTWRGESDYDVFFPLENEIFAPI